MLRDDVDPVASITEQGEVLVPSQTEFRALFDAMPAEPHGGVKCIHVYDYDAVRTAAIKEALAAVLAYDRQPFPGFEAGVTLIKRDIFHRIDKLLSVNPPPR